MKDGRLFFDLPADEYHRDPCAVPSLSSHIAELLVARSPRHAWLAHPRLGGVRQPPSRAMDRGTLLHTLVLGKGQEAVPIDADSWRSKKARQLADDARAAGQLPVLCHELALAERDAASVGQQLEDFSIKLTGQSEVAAFWTETAKGGDAVLCRGMMDHLSEDRRTIYDLKTARSAHPAAVRRVVLDYGYHLQAWAYCRAVAATGQSMPDFVFLFMELEPAVVVQPVRLTEAFYRRASARWQAAVNRWATCLRLDSWPAYSDEIVELSPPTWATPEGA